MKTILTLFLTTIATFCLAQDEKQKDIPSIKVRDNTIYTVAEQMPMFPDSTCLNGWNPRECANQKLNMYVAHHVIYPDSALANGINGTVVLSFIVMPDGRIDSLSVLRDFSGYFAQEGLRLMNKMIQDKGPWIPGRQNGQAVAVRMNLPIRFKIS